MESKKEFERSLINSIASKYDIHELQSIEFSSTETEETEVKKIQKGVFKHKDNSYFLILCRFVDHRKLKFEFIDHLNNLVKVQQMYIGENYVLCLTDSKIYSYNIKYYKTITSIIEEIDNSHPLKILSHEIINPTSFHALIIKTEIADFILAGIYPSNQEEEERVILSNRLQASRPFFEFKAPLYFDWTHLIGEKDEQFEKICELLLQREPNVVRVVSIGKTKASDRGRDFEVIERLDGLNSSSEIKWLVQCKYSEHSISPSSIAGWTDRMIEHKYDGYWLMTNNDITPSLFDQFKDVENNEKYHIKTRFWQRGDFHIKLNVHSELVTRGNFFKLK